jgi:hypothetical protein
MDGELHQTGDIVDVEFPHETPLKATVGLSLAHCDLLRYASTSKLNTVLRASEFERSSG